MYRSRITRPLALCVALLTVGSLLAAPDAVATSTTRASATSRAADAAVRYARAHGMSSGIAVLDTRTGRLTTAGNAHREFASASVVKTLIATRLLLTHQMHGHTATLASSMIRRSDNAAAWKLYPKVGRDGLLPWIARHYRINGLGARPAMHGIWGSTRITAVGMARFYARVRRDATVWPWLSKQMHAYSKRSAANEPNAFGLAAAQPSAAVKNGWDTNRDIEHPRNAIINSTGFVDHDRYAVAILAEGPHRLYYRAGEAIVTHEAQLLFPRRPAARTTHAAAAFANAQTSTACRYRATSCHTPVVVLDPGHNGGNGKHLHYINHKVYAGYGRHKACNTTGTATNHGYSEHAFTFDVAKRVRAILRSNGVQVVMTRTNDHGVGPCVNKRAQIESRKGVAAAVAIHADGARASGHGFHVCEDSRRPVGASAATVLKSRSLSRLVHDSLAAHSGLVTSTYLGHHGYYYRSDLAGLNLSTKPTTFLEIGNMRNRHDARLQSSGAGRERIARAVAAGILAYLER
ncbi:N-acetylmuramoyl-L-alanine amidase [uncultured Jatrophihabitans sp.]|uniref:N-acetylmuramoyl-L-alanine amidase n=1 Tax=uncultured Jatrophihabitans sp. TaxID=1610747 RepID=UPI0035CB2841